MNRSLETALTCLAGLASLAGVGLVVHGLSSMNWPEAIPFSGAALFVDSPLQRFLLLLIAAALVVAIITLAGKCRPLAATAAVVVLLGLGTGEIGAVALVGWIALATTLLGRGVLRLAGMDAAPQVSIALPFLLGVGLYGSVVSLLAHLPLNYPGVYSVALALPVVFGWRSAVALGKTAVASIARIEGADMLGIVLEAAIGLVLLVHVVVACLPELGYDALAMHLFIPGFLRGRHQWSFDVGTYVWAVMPMLGDWIFAIGYMLGGETAARLLNVGFIVVLTRLIMEIVHWSGGSPRGARWAALVFLSTPLTFTESSSLFVESVWGAFLIVGTFELLRACSADGNSHRLSLAGAMLGFAAAAKAVTLTVLPVLVLILLLRWRRCTGKAGAWVLVQALAAFLLIGSIPYLTALIKTGNPVFPLFNAVFRSPYFPFENFAAPDIFAKGVHWNTLYAVTFDTNHYLEAKPGAAGFHWLLLLIPAVLVLVRGRNVRGLAVALIALASIVLTFHSTAYLRYVFPSFALLAALLGASFSVVERDHGAPGSIGGILLAAGVGLNLLFFNAGAFYADFEPRAALSHSHRYEYIEQRMPIRNAVKLVNHLNVGHTPVAMFSMPYAAGMEANALYPIWYNHSFRDAIKQASSEREMAEILLSKEVDFVILDPIWDTLQKRRLVEGATDKIADFGGIAVRTVSMRYRFQRELLQHSDFESAEGWSMLPGAKLDHGLVVSVDAAAFQVVPVSSGRRYRNTVRAVCPDQPTKGRLQVNWQDGQSRLIRADIQLFNCSSEASEHSMDVIAPDGAASAAVYASGNTSTPVLFRQVSFR